MGPMLTVPTRNHSHHSNRRILNLGIGVILFMVPLLALTSAHASPKVFKVTSSTCYGTGSIGEALAMANANPGVDTIEISPKLAIRFNTTECLPNPVDSAETMWALLASESVTINGNGATVSGSNLFVGSDGSLNKVSETDSICPKSHSFAGHLVGVSPGFLRVGNRSGGAGVEVTIKKLNFYRISGLADVRSQAKLTIEDSEATSIVDLGSPTCNSPAIEADEGADVTLKRVRITGGKNYAHHLPYNALIRGVGASGSDRAVLTLLDVDLYDNYMNSLAVWLGDVFIESLKSDSSGGVLFADGTARISNSLISNKSTIGSAWREYDFLRFQNVSATIEASTISMGTTPSCDYTTILSRDGCRGQYPIDSGAPIQVLAGATLELKGSAVQVIHNSIPEHPTKIIEGVNGGVITADQYSFIQPIAAQDAAALRTVTSQPSLITDPPALLNTDSVPEYLVAVWPEMVSPLLGTSSSIGLLVDNIPDAACGGANQVLSPIDGSCIAQDIFKNARVDANGRRSTGAVQTTFAPLVHVNAVQPTSVSLSWAPLREPPSGPITGYAVFCGLKGTQTLARCLNVAGAHQTSAIIPNLAPNTAYDFTVVGVNASGDGPPVAW